MGCGLRKLEDPEDSSPGKIYSTLRRPQVETKTDTVYEYVLLDFSLEGSRPTVQYLSSLCDLPQALQPYYTQGYVLAALHPIILSVGRTRSLACSLLYRAILARPRPSKHAVAMVHSVPVLRVEEWPLPGDSLTSDTVRVLVDRVNSNARGGVRFVGSVLQQAGGGGGGIICNGRMASPRRGYRSPPRTPPDDREVEDGGYSPDLRLLVLFHSWAPGCAPLDTLACCYHQGALSMRVSRKGQVVSGLEADWLELTAAYYRKGWSLVDSFVYWDTPKGEPVPRSLEGLFVYEERSTAPPANDTIVVEQWTVIEVNAYISDYFPTLHSSARLCPQVADERHLNQFFFFLSQVGSSVRRDVVSHSVSRGVAVPHGEELSPCSGGIGGFPVFGGGYPSALSHLEEGGFEQDDGAAEVTCM
uniref:Raftlin family member 2 n=1 Tax=Astyanax mexicanus TaxID=7994 RepID=W5K3T2_ASTMX